MKERFLMKKGLCPVTERMYYEVFTHEYIRPTFTKKELEDVVKCI